MMVYILWKDSQDYDDCDTSDSIWLTPEAAMKHMPGEWRGPSEDFGHRVWRTTIDYADYHIEEWEVKA